MPKFGNRVKESTSTTGTGQLTLDGAPTGFRSFGQEFTSTDEVYYLIVDDIDSPVDFEYGVGTFTAGPPDTLSRDTIEGSSNAGNRVNWQAGSKTVIATPTAASLAGSGPLLNEATATASFARRDQNLADLSSASTARGNLGLGTAALLSTPISGTNIQDQTLSLGKIQAVNGTRIIGRTNTSSGSPQELTLDVSMYISGTTLGVVGSGINRERLKTGTATTSVAVGVSGTADVTFNAYAFFPNIRLNGNSILASEMFIHPHASTFGSSPDAPGFLARNTNNSNAETINIHHRFVQA